MTMELKHERGAYFKENNLPNVRGKVILETTDDLHGEPGYRLAEKDNEEDKWFAYWMPARHLHDEIGVGAAEKAGKLDDDELSTVEEHISVEPTDDGYEIQLEGVTRVKDVMPPAAVEAIIGNPDEE
jgi:hypothetical protein